MAHYKAPWSISLIIVSVLATVLCLFVSSFFWREVGTMRFDTVRFWNGVLPLALILGAGLFTIRSYSITPDAILIHRLAWTTRLPRAGLKLASIEPGALRGSIRLFGNGGLFSVTGLFRSPALGRYRAFITDSARAVVLRYEDRTVVVSPGDPERFVSELSVNERRE